MKHNLFMMAIIGVAGALALTTSAKTIRPLGGSYTDWSSSASYVDNKTPEPGDDCRLDRGDNKTYFVSDSNPASLQAFLKMKHIRIFGTNVTMIVDVQNTTCAQTAALESVYQDGGNASSLGIAYGGRLVKTGPGELCFTNLVQISHLLNCDVEVREGRITLPQTSSREVGCDGYVTISNKATFAIANTTTKIAGLFGEGTVLVPRGSETKCTITGTNGCFFGKVGSSTRFQVFGKQKFYGRESLSQFNQVYNGGVFAAVDFGDVPAPTQSAAGISELRFFGHGAFMNLATEPTLTGRNFALQDLSDGIGFLDAGEYGGWTVTSKVFFARAIGDGSYEYRRMQRFGLKGDNTHESVFSGVLPLCSHGGTNYTMHLTKDGTGVWKIEENQASDLRGAISVKNGTLRFATLAEKGFDCALGKATMLYEDYFGFVDPARAVDWAWKLGAEGTCGELEYVGAENAWTATRSAVVTGEGGKISASGGTRFGMIGGVKPIGDEKTTLKVGGSSAGTNYIGRLSDGAGKLSLVKEGSGTWTLDAGNDFSGSLHVKEGTLRIKDTTRYAWFRWTIRERGKEPDTSTDGIYVKELGLYDANGNRVNAGLRCHTNYVNYATNSLPPGMCGYWRSDVSDYKSGDTPKLLPIDAMFDDDTSIWPGVWSVNAWLYTGKLVRESDPMTWIPVVMHLPYGANRVASFDVVRHYGGNSQRTFRVHSMEGSVDGLHWDLLTNVVHTLGVDYPSSATYGQEGWAFSRAIYTAGSAATHTGGAPIAGGPANAKSALDGVASVRVDAGAILEGESTAVEIGGLEIDEKGAGTIRCCSFAQSGIVNLVNHEKSFAGELPLSFDACENAANLNGWQACIGGEAIRGRQLQFSGNKLMLIKTGMTLFLR